MNDIEKAMASLREERRPHTPPPVAVAAQNAEIEPSSSDIERSVKAGAAARIRPNDERGDAGIGNDVSASVAGASASTRNGVHSNTDRWSAEAIDDDTPPPATRRRFDEELFDDDLLDGVGSRRHASSSSARSGSSTNGRRSSGAYPLDADFPSADGISAGGDHSVLDMPELGIVTASSKGDAFARDMPELGIVATSPSGSGAFVPDAVEPDVVSGDPPCARRPGSKRPESGVAPERSSSGDRGSVSGTLDRRETVRAPIEDDESPTEVPSGRRESGSSENGKPPTEATDRNERPPAGTADRDVVRNEPRRTLSLPLRRLAESGFLTPGAPKGRLSEEFRRVKRPILRNIADASETDGHRNVVMVTSSVAGEGKTYTAINLAISLAAERERTVLLVDADVLKGSAGTFLGVESSLPGLIDVLDDERLDIADVMLATDVPDLRFIPAGRRDEQTTELLSSPRMSDLIDELARRHRDRIIVLDCPPMLQTNEANVIADHAGQVVFVVAGEETDQRLVLEAMRRFDEDKSVGILLNKASDHSAAYGYDYGYG